MNAKFRQSIYYVGTVISSVLGLALVWGGLSEGAATHLNTLIAGALALVGASAPAVAARQVGKQIHDGAFDSSDPVSQISNSIKAVNEQLAQARAQAEAVKSVVSDAIDDVPVLGPMAADALSKLKF